MGVVKLTFLLIVYTVIGALLLIAIPGIPPDVRLDPYEVKPAAKLEGKLAPNAKLDKAELVFDGDFTGPESVAIRNDEVYTGVDGGYIVRVKNGKAETIVQTGKPCAGPWEVEKCGRPLGLRFDPSGKLLVADATQGLLRVDVDKKTVERLLPRDIQIEGSEHHLNFVDDVDVSKDGIIYFSDAGIGGTFGDILIDVIGEPTGRLIKYDPKTRNTEVLISGMRFANGVQLSKKEDFLIVCESGMGRVLKYYLKGSKKGEIEIFVDGLPGFPDNARSNGKGGFYIALVISRDPQNPGPLENLSTLPWVRKLYLRFQRAIIMILQLINSYAENEQIAHAIAYMRHMGPLGAHSALPGQVVIVEVTEGGEILGSLQNKDGKISYISEVSVGEKYTYFGSPYTPHLWRIKTEDL